MDSLNLDEVKNLALGVGGTGLVTWFARKYILPLIGSKSKKLVSDDDVGTKANQALIAQIERLEAEISRLSEKLKKREEKIEEEIDEKNKLLKQLYDLRVAMGNEGVLLLKNKELQDRLNIAEAKILELEDLLTRMAQAKENTNTKIVSSD
jgi:signal transduction histidine kinase